MDERRRPHAQNARTREGKDDGDRAPIEAERGSDASESDETWRDIGVRSEEESRFSPTSASDGDRIPGTDDANAAANENIEAGERGK